MKITATDNNKANATQLHTHTLTKSFNSPFLGMTALYVFFYFVVLNVYRI